MLNIEIKPEGAEEVSRVSRGTPRIANRLLKRVRDFAQIKADNIITGEVSREALQMLQLDRLGLDEIDRRLLITLLEKFNGGPVGLDTLATAISEQPETLEDVYEPYLMKLGFLKRTPRGRVITDAACSYLDLKPGTGDYTQPRLW